MGILQFGKTGLVQCLISLWCHFKLWAELSMLGCTEPYRATPSRAPSFGTALGAQATPSRTQADTAKAQHTPCGQVQLGMVGKCQELRHSSKVSNGRRQELRHSSKVANGRRQELRHSSKVSNGRRQGLRHSSKVPNGQSRHCGDTSIF